MVFSSDVNFFAPILFAYELGVATVMKITSVKIINHTQNLITMDTSALVLV